MTDIIADLEDAAQSAKASGGGEYREYQSIQAGIAEILRLRATIDQLRSVAGAVSLDGPTFRDFKNQAFQKAQGSNDG